MAPKRIALLVENLYQELDVWYTLLRLREEGVEVETIGTGTQGDYLGRHNFAVRVEKLASSVDAGKFDGVIVPGGFAPAYLRRYPAVVNLVRECYQQEKLVAALHHGPWVLISAGVVRGKRVTGAVSVKDDVENAGGEFVDLPVVVDGNLVTARSSQELPAFIQEVLGFLWRQKPRLNETFPDGFLYDSLGNLVVLSDLIRRTPAVLLFIDSVFNTLFSELLPDYQRLNKRVKERGGLFLVISGDPFPALRYFLAQAGADYQVFSDPLLRLGRSFGVLNGMGLLDWNVLVVDRNGAIRYREKCPDGDLKALPGFERQLEILLQRGA
ncbi:MAG TPA: DJ-1/PfpI/YhbO family deglycase/protease [Candidatus Atribacteria bacterium]|nr:DJ-1/PfpI/YhbO family deglycase/protease [Candidatus Atribacteria bacterium]